MKKLRIKSSVILMFLGIIVGFLISTIIKELSMKYIFMFIALLFLMIISLSWVITNEFDLKIMNAYEKGLRYAEYLPPKHMNCRCGPNPYADKDRESE